MKTRVMVAAAVAMAVIGAGTGVVVAGHGPGEHPMGPPPGMEPGGRGAENRMARILNLSTAQQRQIQTIMETEREQVKPLFDKMHEIRKQLMLAGESAKFDEAAVRRLATEQSRIEVELTVSRTKTDHKINALLTPEQRELQQRLRPELEH